MKTTTFLLCFFFLVSCGKDNKSGNRPAPESRDQETFRSEAQILSVQQTRNGVMVQGNLANFAIPVTGVTNYFYSRNLVGVIYQAQGLRVRVYNSMGHMLINGNAITSNPRLNVRDDVAGLEYQDRLGKSHYIGVSTRRTLVEITADDIRGEVKHGVIAVTYRNRGTERAIAVKSTGQILLPDNRTYVRPRFTIDPYSLILSHTMGIEQISH